jgi:hypothetical protein
MHKGKGVVPFGRPRCRSSGSGRRVAPAFTTLTRTMRFVDVSASPCEPVSAADLGDDDSPIGNFSRTAH